MLGYGGVRRSVSCQIDTRGERAVVKHHPMFDEAIPLDAQPSHLAQNIFVLRKTLGESAGQHRYIATIPGRGYRFVAKVRVVKAEERLVVQSHERSKVVIEQSRPRRPLAIAAVGVAAGDHASTTVGSGARLPEPIWQD
jgi:hypothetical protein